MSKHRCCHHPEHEDLSALGRLLGLGRIEATLRRVLANQGVIMQAIDDLLAAWDGVRSDIQRLLEALQTEEAAEKLSPETLARVTATVASMDAMNAAIDQAAPEATEPTAGGGEEPTDG